MAQKSETVFKNKIRSKLEALPNIWVCKVQQVSLRGDPDFILCLRGAFVALELKKDAKEEPQALQWHKLGKIKLAGGIALVVYPSNWDETYKYLKKLSCKTILKTVKFPG